MLAACEPFGASGGSAAQPPSPQIGEDNAGDGGRPGLARRQADGRVFAGTPAHRPDGATLPWRTHRAVGTLVELPKPLPAERYRCAGARRRHRGLRDRDGRPAMLRIQEPSGAGRGLTVPEAVDKVGQLVTEHRR